MKKIYDEPVLNFVEFSSSDVLTDPVLTSFPELTIDLETENE